jgi:hypothetical protein
MRMLLEQPAVLPGGPPMAGTAVRCFPIQAFQAARPPRSMVRRPDRGVARRFCNDRQTARTVMLMLFFSAFDNAIAVGNINQNVAKKRATWSVLKTSTTPLR